MPQMNPMNWLMLFLYFSSILVGCFVKLHFHSLSIQEEASDLKRLEKTNNFQVLV